MNTLEIENYDTAIAADAPPYPSPYSSLCQGSVHLGGTVATISVIAVILLGVYAVSLSLAAMGQDEDLTERPPPQAGGGHADDHRVASHRLHIGPHVHCQHPVLQRHHSASSAVVSTCCPCSFFWRMLAEARRALRLLHSESPPHVPSWTNTTASPKCCLD